MTKDEALRLALEALGSNRRTHHYCEDTWYSCPKHEDGCANEHEGDECNCGADEANAGIDQAITAIKAALEAKDEPVIDKSAAKRIATQLGWEPPRTPIADEDIRQAEHHMVCGAYDYSFKQGVKWAEKAHGIKWEWER